MTFKHFVTFFVGSVIFLASTVKAQNTSTTQARDTQPETLPISAVASLSRSTSLIDFKDGTRSDGLDVVVIPAYKLSIGRLSAVIAYTRNLRDPYSRTENDWNDIPVTLSFKARDFGWFKNRSSSVSFSASAVLPVSQTSTKKDQLQTAVAGKVSLSSAPKGGEGFSAGLSLSLGKNFHQYSEDINGNVLNQYSSNQGVQLGYALGSWSFSTEFINKTRLTYQNNVKSAFEWSEEIGYEINRNISLAFGHTNAGSTLKSNGFDSNVNFFNENSSMIYGTLNLIYE